MSMTTTRHPIDRLSEATSFREALGVMRDAITREAALLNEGSTERPGDDWARQREVARRRADLLYRDVYERPMAAMQEALALAAAGAMTRSGLEDYGAALATGDYHGYLAF